MKTAKHILVIFRILQSHAYYHYNYKAHYFMLVIDVSFLRLKINEIEKSQLNHHQALFLFRPRAKRGDELIFYTIHGY